MRTLRFALLLLIASIGIVGCTTTSPPAAAWEYKLMRDHQIRNYGAQPGESDSEKVRGQRVEKCLQDLGANGWEYIGQLANVNKGYHVFKRPIE